MSEDPKKKAGDLKAPLHILPTVALRETAHVLKLGADKYGVYNWREPDGIKATTYTAAMMRHLLQYTDGEDVDEESGRSHLAHIMATCSILLDAERVGNLIDDRPKLKKRVEPWESPCGLPHLCRNSAHIYPCQSCTLHDGRWTKYRDPE